MDLYLLILLAVILLITFIVLFLWIVLYRTRNNRKLNMRDASLTSEELEDHARENAQEHAVTQKRNILNWPVPRLNNNYDFILAAYKRLNEDIQDKNIILPSAEWLLDNFYVIEQQVKGLRRDLNKKSYLRLPVLRSGNLKGYARIFAVAVELVAHTDGQMDEKTLSDYLKAYQSHSVLFDREIWAIPTVIRLALIERIRYLCENIKNTQLQWHEADAVFDDWLASEDDDTNQTEYMFRNRLESMDEVNPSFIEHLFYRLRRSGRSYGNILRVMDENLAQWGASTESITQKEHGTQSTDTISMGNCITSLHYFSSLDWADLFASASIVEQILNQDPDGTYPQMDVKTRNYYRQKIEELAATYGVSELKIAREAVLLADLSRSESERTGETDDVTRRTWHVGYYLIGKGAKTLGKRQEREKHILPKPIYFGQKHHGILYLGAISLITALLAAAGAAYAFIASARNPVLLAVLAAAAVLIPSSEIAVNAVNWVVSKSKSPAVFPRLELKDGIPESMSAIVAVPTLLPDEKRVRELLANLESHYLSNREKNLYFALIGAFKDSDDPSMKNDGMIIKAALDGIKALNRKYSGTGPDKFYFFHRASQFNERNNKWIGWERKRGALMEFNDLVLGATDTSFSYFSCENPPFSHVKYIITLDSDTILPIGMARKMVGTMAHPLNKPVIDPARNVVVEGYGLMQPRIDVDIESSNKSLFSRILTGQEGADPYANAISDVYQDLFSEGIFTGKGIYDLRTFQTVLQHSIPEDAILSHDLLEGSYARTGLVSDLKLVDSYPSKYNSYDARLHRWVRGDWQLVPLLFGKIANKDREKIKNPLSLLSRWKMFDNLRRSLAAPSLMILAVLGFSILPGSISIWLGFFAAALAMPFLIAMIGYLFSGRIWRDSTKRHMPVIDGLKATLIQGLLTLTFLPYQAWSMTKAITVTLVRVLITKKNLLEWVTSAAQEKSQKNTLKSYLSMMRVSLCGIPVILALAILFKPAAALVCLPLFVLWECAPFIAFRISSDRKDAVPNISEEDRHELGRIARKTWRYFEEFANSRSHYLAPDNYQTDPPRGGAYRTSPTNIGFGLLAVMTARDLGYISTSWMIELIGRTVSTMEQLEKWNGHLYNWYDTQSLRPLRPGYISTVDSGNLIGYLITLTQGLHEYLRRPLVDQKFSDGIRDTLFCAGQDGIEAYKSILSDGKLQGIDPVDLVVWNQTLDRLMRESAFDGIKNNVWKAKTGYMIRIFQKEMAEMMPGADLLAKIPGDLSGMEEDEAFSLRMTELQGLLRKNAGLHDLPAVYMQAAEFAGQLIDIIRQKGTGGYPDGLSWLSLVSDTMTGAIDAAKQLTSKISALIERINAMIDAARFLPLYDVKKQMFSIGFNLEENKLSNSYYDLLASEARQTSYICIARGEIPMPHWFVLGRALTVVDRYKGLISWTGTMFEYLMPLLIMKTYKNTLFDETYSFVIKSQKKYGRQRDMPWGASESAFNSLDINLDYQYKAIGVPWLGLKRGLIEDAVVAPYASCLALLVDPEGAVQNLKRLKGEGLDGPYGYYEAADYTPERLPFEEKRAVVKSFMAHHQGMSLLAINNFLNQNIMQTRFHADPAVNSARLLLQEKVPANIVFTKDMKEKVIPYTAAASKEKSAIRRFSQPDPVLPKAHILSNGNYSIMITDRGTGYSKNKMTAVTRWRADSTLDPYGMFFYLRNADTNAVWSATYSPLNKQPEQYEVVFTADKASFRRMDDNIETKTEVIAVSGDNAEIRRITLKNHGIKPCTLEVTSYFEVVLETQAADVAHPAFSNLFVETCFDADRKCLVANRRSRSETDKDLWIAHSAVIEGEAQGDVEYETDRMQMIGRGHQTRCPIVMELGKPLSNSVGPVLDPVMSLRIRVKIEPGMTAKISFLTAVSESNEHLLSLADKYSGSDAVEGAFRLALTRSKLETTYLNFGATDMELYQDMMSHILFLSPTRRTNQELILPNKRSQASLWRYGISGDLPIVFVVLNNTNRVEILNEILKAHEYWRLMDLKVDLVILSDEEYSYALSLHALIADIVLSSQTHDILNKPRDIFILDKNRMPAEDVSLLYASAKVILTGDGRTMTEQIDCRSDLPLPRLRSFTGGQPEAARPAAFEEPELNIFNGLGGFSPDGNEYVIRLQKGQTTPAPWVNIIANPEFGFIVSEAGSGYAWYGNSRENKLTPWSNDAVSDTPGEVLYIGDRDTGRLWTVTSLPIRENEPYTIRHGFGYSIFEHNSNGIEQTLSQHVPVDAPVKVSLLHLKNVSGQIRRLTLTYYMQPVLGVSDQATAMHIRSNISETGVILLENPYSDDFAGKIAYMDVSSAERTYTCDRREFFGSGDISRPECLSREALSGTTGAGIDPCAAMQTEVILEPDENRDIIFLMGMAPRLPEAEETARLYRNIDNVKNSFLAVQAFWKTKMDVVRVDTPVESMNLMLNGWLQYQVLSCRLWTRSGFYQSGGAFGFRDQLQDCLSVAPLWPEIARAQILLHARHQFTQGDVQHWWHEPSGKGIRSRIADDRLWLPYAAAEYIRITGDRHILAEMVPFLEERPLLEDENERYGCPGISNETASLYNHCIRAVEISLKFGAHGLPLMGTGDWNDGMNTVGSKGSGESVWLGWFLSSVLNMMSPICTLMDDKERSERYTKISGSMIKAIEKNGWDGNWYRRAYFDNGQPLGSALNHDCKIDSIAQTWSVISGQGNRARQEQAMKSLEMYLVQRENGLVKLLTPPFDQGDSEPGYIKGYVPGVRENGGQYTHAAAWVIIAFAMLGDGDKAGELFELINPINHTGNPMDVSRYKAEPYVMAADVYAVNPHIGRGGWTWYTGSAGWMYRAGLESILGFQKRGDILVIDPCIPKTWRQYSVQYKYAASLYEITVINPEGINRGVRQVSVDGEISADSQIHLVDNGQKHVVEVLMGETESNINHA